jgi:hypothetical protein
MSPFQSSWPASGIPRSRQARRPTTVHPAGPARRADDPDGWEKTLNRKLKALVGRTSRAGLRQEATVALTSGASGRQPYWGPLHRTRCRAANQLSAACLAGGRGPDSGSARRAHHPIAGAAARSEALCRAGRSGDRFVPPMALERLPARSVGLAGNRGLARRSKEPANHARRCQPVGRTGCAGAGSAAEAAKIVALAQITPLVV